MRCVVTNTNQWYGDYTINRNEVYKWGTTKGNNVIRQFLGGELFSTGGYLTPNGDGSLLAIGSRGRQISSNRLSGHIKHFRIFRRELTAEEMALAHA